MTDELLLESVSSILPQNHVYNFALEPETAKGSGAVMLFLLETKWGWKMSYTQETHFYLLS